MAILNEPKNRTDKAEKMRKYETLLTTEQVAEYLNVSRGTLEVWRCTKAHNLPYIKMGGLIRYRLYDLVNFIDQYYEETPKEVEKASRERGKKKDRK